MSNYPDWVNAFKEKGTSVKKIGNEYYLYRSTSKGVPGKKCPQPVQQYIGIITREGVMKTHVRKISTNRVKVYEYGMSFVLQSLLTGIAIEDLRPPSELYLVETKQCDMLSEVTSEMSEILARLGVKIHAV